VTPCQGDLFTLDQVCSSNDVYIDGLFSVKMQDALNSGVQRNTHLLHEACKTQVRELLHTSVPLIQPIKTYVVWRSLFEVKMTLKLALKTSYLV
jgi:hypothetical protein